MSITIRLPMQNYRLRIEILKFSFRAFWIFFHEGLLLKEIRLISAQVISFCFPNETQKSCKIPSKHVWLLGRDLVVHLLLLKSLMGMMGYCYVIVGIQLQTMKQSRFSSIFHSLLWVIFICQIVSIYAFFVGRPASEHETTDDYL